MFPGAVTTVAVFSFDNGDMTDRTIQQQSLSVPKQTGFGEARTPKTQLRANAEVMQELNGGFRVIENLLGRALLRSSANVMTLVLAGWAMQLRDLQKAKDYFVKANILDPDNGAVLIGLAHLSRLAHDYNEAMSLLNRASSTALSDELRRFLNVMLASVFQKKGQPEEAVKKASEAIIAYENDANSRANIYLKKTAYAERALAYLSTNDIERALADLKSALAVEGKDFKPTGKPLVDLQRALGMLG